MEKVKEWIRRPQVWGFAVGVAVMAIISIAFFFPDNIDGNSLRQYDMVQGAANGQEGKAFYEATGEKALWTDALLGGMPTFQISPSYPSNSLFTWLNSVYGLGLPAPSNLLFMMMLGFFILMYVMNFRWYYSLIGAIAWGFSSYFIIIIGAGHIWKFVTLAYIPPTIGGLMLIYRGRYVGGAALLAVFAMLQLNANHPQMTYYFGFLILALIIAWLVEAKRQKKLRQWAIATAVSIGAGCLALGANLPSLYNTYEYSKETKRSQSELAVTAEGHAVSQGGDRPTGGLPKSEILAWCYGQSETFSLLIPNIKGGSSEHGLAELPEAEAYMYSNPAFANMLAQMPQYFNDSEGTSGPVYVGAIICVLFLIGCVVVKGPVKWALVVMTVLSILLAWGINFEWFTDLFIYYVPMYNKFRAVESILVVAEFTMPLLALMGLREMMKDRECIRRHKKAIFIAFGFCGLVSLMAIFTPSAFGDAITSQEQEQFANALDQYAASALEQGMPMEQVQQNCYALSLSNPNNVRTIEDLRYGMVKSDGLRSFVFLALMGMLLWAYDSGKMRRGYVVAACGVLVLIDLYGVDKRYVNHERFIEVDSSAPMIQPDAIDLAIMKDTDHYRVMDIPGFARAERSYFHNMVGGYHAAKLNRYEDLITNLISPSQIYGYMPQLRDEDISALSPEEQELLTQLLASYRTLDMLNARYIITGNPRQPYEYNPHALGNAWLVDNIKFVDGAKAEMDALMSLDPKHEAVADRKFSDVLGTVAGSLAPGDTIYMTGYTPNRVEYRSVTSQPSIGVFSEVWFPWGWKATIDGQPAPIGRVNYLLRAMAIPAGTHEIVMTFDPDSLHVTGGIAYASVSIIYMLVILALFIEWQRRRRAIK